MVDKYEIEIFRRVYENDNGRSLTVAPSADFPGNVMLLAEGKESEYFGDIRLDMPAAFMEKLGHALISAAKEAEA